MTRRLYALSFAPLADDDPLLAECEKEVERTDWWLAAEFAGFEDDDEASALVDRILDDSTTTKRREARAVLEMQLNPGKVSFQALRGHARATTHELRMFFGEEAQRVIEPYFARVVDGIVITITGFPDIEEDLVARATHGAAIGLVEKNGIVVDGATVWDPAKVEYLVR
jgi:hypothetical protein